MRRLVGLAIGAVAGGVLGYTHVLCPGGTCPLTGSWFGGALLGGVVRPAAGGRMSGVLEHYVSAGSAERCSRAERDCGTQGRLIPSGAELPKARLLSC